MIDELNNEQETKLAAERKRYFDFATSTKPADRPRAESALHALVEIGGVRIDRIVWVASPEVGMVALMEEWNSLSASLGASLSASLRDSLSASLFSHYWETPWFALHLGARDILDVSYAQEDARRLALWSDLIASCWAAWVAPGVAILCDRPETVEIDGDRLLGMTWRKE